MAVYTPRYFATRHRAGPALLGAAPALSLVTAAGLLSVALLSLPATFEKDELPFGMWGAAFFMGMGRLLVAVATSIVWS